VPALAGPRRVVARARATERSRWWTTFLLVASLSSLWLLATPLFGAPDEPAHSVRAASVARLDVVGDEEPEFKDRLVVEAPKSYGDAAKSIACYVFGPTIPASCAKFDDHNQLVRLPTSAGRHPPAYYFVAGLPTLAVRGALSIYLMRVVSAVITAAFVASAVATLERLRRPRLGALAILIGATPMMFFIGGTVNPSSVELPAALSLWMAGAVLALEAPKGVDSRLVRRVAVAAIALVLSRQLAPLWLALIAAALIAIGGTAMIRALWASRSARRWGVAVLVAAVLQCLWIVIVRPLDPSLGDKTLAHHLTTGTALKTSLGETLNRLREMVGWFGWLDTPSPGVAYMLWVIALGALLALALFAWHRRLLLVAAATAVAAIAAPVGFETIQAHKIGFFWQGRYSMPLALGVPVLLALSAALGAKRTESEADDSTLSARGVDRVVGAVAIAIVVAQVAAFWQALRRNSVGYNGAFDFLIHPDWSPPAPVWFLVVAYAIVVSAFAFWVASSTSGSVESGGQPEPTPSGSLRNS
jgi:hypothetical protein